MSNMRTTEICGLLTRWLERYSPPQQMRGNARAQQDEAQALSGTLLKFAPHVGYADFVNEVLDKLDYQMKTRAWPRKGELGAICVEITKSRKWSPTDLSKEVTSITDAAIAAKKMTRGDAVGEAHLYGIPACEIIAEQLVDEATMRKYRDCAFVQQREAYGQDAAVAWKQRAEAKHLEAKQVYRQRKSGTRRHECDVPDMRPKVNTSWVDEIA